MNAQQRGQLQEAYEHLLRAPMTDVEAFFYDLSGRDWSYQYSDSSSVYKSGTEHVRRLEEKFKELKDQMTSEQVSLAMRGIAEGNDPSDYYDEIKKQYPPQQAPALSLIAHCVLIGMTAQEYSMIPQLRKDLGEVYSAVCRGNSYDQYHVYSPFMIKSRDLAIHNARLGSYDTPVKMMAISTKAETLIDKLLKKYSGDFIQKYIHAVGMSDGENYIDLVEGDTKRHHFDIRFFTLKKAGGEEQCFRLLQVGYAKISMGEYLSTTNIMETFTKRRMKYYSVKTGMTDMSELLSLFLKFDRSQDSVSS